MATSNQQISESNQQSLNQSHQTRVEAGKKAAKTRGYESLAAAGRKGGQASGKSRRAKKQQ